MSMMTTRFLENTDRTVSPAGRRLFFIGS